MNARGERAIHLDLDGAWQNLPLDLPRIDARDWGPKLRFTAPKKIIEEFSDWLHSTLATHHSSLLYGSGDFHHLTAIFLRRIQQPFTLVSFDNHPDWAITPPRWSCGGWINRALELPQVQRAVIWGCGNFECWWPHQILGNRKAERAGKLVVHPWADNRSPKEKKRRGAILRENWRDHFLQFARELNGSAIYVTIDLDCLRSEEAVTNWESGRFNLEDVQWALGILQQSAEIIGADMCGTYSPPKFARRAQQFAANFDHPKIELPAPEAIAEKNRVAFKALWPTLKL